MFFSFRHATPIADSTEVFSRRIPIVATVFRLQDAIAESAARHAPLILRLGLGVVFLWFGALKLFPGVSPAEGLVLETTSFVNPSWFYPLLACWEIGLGCCFLSGRGLRLALPLLFAHMCGTALPLLMVPETVWTDFPFVLTLEGQYIIKNLVLVGAGITLWGSLISKKSPRD